MMMTMMMMWGSSLVAAARGEMTAEGRARWVAGVVADSTVGGLDLSVELEAEEPALNLKHAQ